MFIEKFATSVSGLIGDDTSRHDEPMTGPGRYGQADPSPDNTRRRLKSAPRRAAPMTVKGRNDGKSLEKIGVLESNNGNPGPGNDLTAKHKRVKQSPREELTPPWEGFIDHFMSAVQNKKSKKKDLPSAHATNGAFDV